MEQLKFEDIAGKEFNAGKKVNVDGKERYIVAPGRFAPDRYEYRIRKLTAKECWRLMGFTDKDYHKAEAVNSQTQLYKEAGNSIVVSVLAGIFSQLNISGVKPWNDMTDEERENLVRWGGDSG